MERLHKIGFAKLTPLEKALEQLFQYVTLNDSEIIQTTKSLNRILAEDIISSMDIPPFTRAAMDGYAIKAEDSFGTSIKNPKKVKKVGTIEIGEISDIKLNPGEAIRISTGAAIPEGADVVIKIEDTEIKEDIVTLFASLVPEKNISKRGEDISKGSKVLEQGLDIKSEHIALISSLGIEKIKVMKKPNVSVFATGDELIEVGTPFERNKIYNSNSPMISALVKLYGGSIVRENHLRDDKELIKSALKEACEDSQIVIFTGGTSVGTKDYLPEIINELGNVLTHGIAMRPGSPLLIAQLNKSIIFCLPGTPVAAYITFLIAVGLTIRKTMGCLKLDPRIEIIANISMDVPVGGLGYRSFLRVKIEKLNYNFIADPVRLKGSGIISSLTKSDGIVEIPPNTEGLKKGDSVIVKLFPR